MADHRIAGERAGMRGKDRMWQSVNEILETKIMDGESSLVMTRNEVFGEIEEGQDYWR